MRCSSWSGILGFIPGGPANFVPLNTADNWLDFVLGVGMILLGVVAARRSSTYADRGIATPSAG